MTESRAHQDPSRVHVPEDVRQHLDVARAEMRKGLGTFLPDGLSEHRDAARREMLLAGRALLDAAIRRADAKKSQA